MSGLMGDDPGQGMHREIKVWQLAIAELEGLDIAGPGGIRCLVIEFVLQPPLTALPAWQKMIFPGPIRKLRDVNKLRDVKIIEYYR